MNKNSGERGSLYTHDVVLEKLTNDIKNILLGKPLETSNLRNINAKKEVEEKKKSQSQQLQILNNISNNIEKLLNKMSEKKTETVVREKQNRDINTVNQPMQREIPDEIENLSLFLYNKN
jgi:hypothetical protein